jgi:hypothetical protein
VGIGANKVTERNLRRKKDGDWKRMFIGILRRKFNVILNGTLKRIFSGHLNIYIHTRITAGETRRRARRRHQCRGYGI